MGVYWVFLLVLGNIHQGASLEYAQCLDADRCWNHPIYKYLTWTLRNTLSWDCMETTYACKGDPMDHGKYDIFRSSYSWS